MSAAAPRAAEPNRWAVLALVGVAQLMVILDSTIVNIALPSAQRDLGFSTENRQWVVTAYALAFGSLLLVGGKIGDLFGRKWTFIAGLIGFSAASFLGGLAPSFEVLVIARALRRLCRCSPSRSRTRRIGRRRSASSPRSRPPARRWA